MRKSGAIKALDSFQKTLNVILKSEDLFLPSSVSVLYEVGSVRRRLAICGNDSKSRMPMLPRPMWAPLPGQLHKDRAVAPRVHGLVPGPPRATLAPVLIPTFPTSFETESLASKVLHYESTKT